MKMIYCGLTVAIAATIPSPAAASDPASCARADNRCKAHDFERKAGQAASEDERAVYLFGAHRSYIFLYQETGEAADLCAARRALRASLAVEGQSENQRADSRAALAKLSLLARERGIRCSSSGRPLKTSATTGEGPLTASDAAAQPVADLGRNEQEEGPQAVASTELITTDSTAPPHTPELLPSLNAPRHPFVPVHASQTISIAPQPDRAPSAEDPAPRPGRSLVIAGSAALGLGLSLGGVATFAGIRAVDIHRQGEQLINGNTHPSDEDLKADQRLESNYHAKQNLALATAIAGGAVMIVGAVLVAVGGKRLRRASPRTAFAPVPGGLALHGRF